MIRILLCAKAREAGNAPSLPVAWDGLQGCVAALGITDESRLRIDDTAVVDPTRSLWTTSSGLRLSCGKGWSQPPE